jgi:hypothetical protein
MSLAEPATIWSKIPYCDWVQECVSDFCERRYEGLASVNVPHNKGVMVFGSGTGAGIQTVEPNDR